MGEYEQTGASAEVAELLDSGARLRRPALNGAAERALLSGLAAHRPLVALSGIALFSLGIHLLLGAAVHGPFVFMDELGYERNAFSLSQSGHLDLFGKGGLSYSPLYSMLLAPLYAFASGAAQAYSWAKDLNAVLMSLSVFPAYGVARFVLSRRAAVAAAGLAALAPLTLYASLMMSENLAYPLFLLAVWAALRALRTPSLGNDVLLLGATLAAVAARLQLVVLVPAVATAIVAVALVRARRERVHPALAASRALRRHWVFLAPIVLGGVAAAARALENGGSLPLAGRYANVGTARADPIRVLEIAFQHLAGLDLAVGVAPFAASLLGLVALRRSGFPRDAVIFAAVAVSATFWILLEVAFDAAAFDSEPNARTARSAGLPPDLPRIHERYLIYLIPFFLVAFVAIIRRSRIPVAAVLCAASVAALLPGAIPFGRYINNSIVIDSFALQIFGVSVARHAIQPIAHATTTALVISGILAAYFALAMLRRYRGAPIVFVATTLVLLSAVAWIRLFAAGDAASSTYRALPASDEWVDRVVGKNQVVMVGGRGARRTGLLQTAFYNLSIERVYYTCKMAFGGDFGESRLVVGADGALRLGASEVRARYAVVPARLSIAGRVLARNPKGGLLLIAPAGGRLVVAPPARAAARCAA